MTQVDERGQRSATVPTDETRWVVVVVLGSILLLFARAPFAIARFWAEDGVIFYQDAHEDGIISSFGEAWAGYYHLIPRMTGAITSSVPIQSAPYVNWIIIAAFIAWCSATVFVSSRTWLSNMPARLLLAAGVVLLPALRHESIANIANLHFIMLFPTLLVLISKPSTRAERVNGSVFVLAAVLSTLQTLVLAPVVAYRILSKKPWRLDSFSLLWILGSVAHLAAVFITSPSRPRDGTPSLASVVKSFGRGVLADNFVPVSKAPVLTGTLVALVVAGIVGWALVVTWRNGDRHRSVLLVLVPASGSLLWLFLGLRLGYTAARYAVFPSMCLTWSVLVASETLIGRLEPQHWIRRWGGVSLVGALLLVAWLPHWPPDSYRSQGRSWHDTLVIAEERCRSEGSEIVVMQIPPATDDIDLWPVRIRCSELP